MLVVGALELDLLKFEVIELHLAHPLVCLQEAVVDGVVFIGSHDKELLNLRSVFNLGKADAAENFALTVVSECLQLLLELDVVVLVGDPLDIELAIILVPPFEDAVHGVFVVEATDRKKLVLLELLGEVSLEQTFERLRIVWCFQREQLELLRQLVIIELFNVGIPREHNEDSIFLAFEGEVAETRRQENVLGLFMDQLQDRFELGQKCSDAELFHNDCQLLEPGRELFDRLGEIIEEKFWQGSLEAFDFWLLSCLDGNLGFLFLLLDLTLAQGNATGMVRGLFGLTGSNMSLQASSPSLSSSWRTF
jgi:hypothetical protein